MPSRVIETRPIQSSTVQHQRVNHRAKIARLIRSTELQSDRPEHLRVLIANELAERLEATTQIVVGLGHEVIARSLEVGEVAAITAQRRPDVALVGVGSSSSQALHLI